MDYVFYRKLVNDSLQGRILNDKICLDILTSQKIELLPLLQAAYEVRKKFFGNEVRVHILNNVKNGLCKEDCNYCAQSVKSKAPIETFNMKSDEEIIREAGKAYKNGAFRYCMVTSGFSPSEKILDRFVNLIKKIKALYPIEVCVSPGVLNEAQLKKLKDAGLDRLNHNINTSRKFYKKICSTHSFEDRLETIKSACKIGLSCCSGIIAGMGETPEDIVFLAKELRKQKNVRSIPVNFYMPIQGNQLKKSCELSPAYCLKILCLFRLLNPSAEIRAAAGREMHLRSMEVFCLYPANSFFMQGYLNVKGESRLKDLLMIKDAGFIIRSDYELDALIKNQIKQIKNRAGDSDSVLLKRIEELRPFLKK